MRLAWLFILLGWGTLGFAGNIDKAFEALRIYDYFKARQLFYKGLKREPAAASYGLAVIYFRKDNPFHHPDSATKYIRQCMSSLPNALKVSPEKYQKWNVSIRDAEGLRDAVYELAFSNARNVASISSYEYFIGKYTDAPQWKSAVFARDSIAFTMATLIDSWAAYKEFNEKCPGSAFGPEAERLYQERLFMAWTISGKVKSYESFLEKFPDSPHREDAENAIFGLSTLNGTIDEYYLFTRNYPGNRNVEKAWYNIYTLYTKDFKPETFNDFLKVFPDYPYSENVNRDLELSKLILLPGRKNGKWGFVDTTGKEAIPFLYEWCEQFVGGLAAVGMNGKAGFIDKTGRVVFAMEFDEVENFSEGLAEVTRENRSGVVKITGKQIIPCEFEEITFEHEQHLIGLKKNGKYGFCDLNGQLVIPYQFDKAAGFVNGLAAVESAGRWGYINAKGQMIIPPTYEWASSFGSDGFARVKRNGKLGLIDRSGKEIIPCKYKMIGDLSEGLRVVEDSAHYGFMDSTGAWIIPAGYESLRSNDPTPFFKNGLALGKKAGKTGLVDTKGKFVVPYDYEEIIPIQNETSLYIVKKNGKYGVIDRHSKTVIPIQYKRLLPAGTCFLFSMETEGDWGLIGKDRKVIAKPQWEEINILKSGKFFIVGLDEHFGLISSDGTVILPTEFTEMELFEDWMLIEKDGKISWFNILTQKVIWKED